MPSIKIQGLTVPKSSSGNYTYVDVAFDVRKNNLIRNDGLYKEENSTDIEVSYDEGAIKNALVNLFNTTPGQKILEPEFGLNLRKFLFDPLTEITAQLIGESIYNGISRWEPRVKIVNVDVQRDVANYQFNISLTLLIPKLSNSEVKMTGILNKEQFNQT